MQANHFEIIRDTRLEGSSPFITYIVPCYNVEREVVSALNSIGSATLMQAVELILIDDGSSDETLAAMMSVDWGSEILILTQENRGLSYVRNLGASLARGKWLAFLDSDDLITTEGFRAMAALAAGDAADVILGRTEIFGDRLIPKQPFYDSALWDRILDGRSEIYLSIRQRAMVLALEPNMNYRWIRRDFYLESGITFPEGLLFEDAPAHFQMLLGAKIVALTSTVYYLYRVNRPGKITEEKGLRRFDVIPVLRIATKVLLRENPDPLAAAFGLRVLFRLCWGCGTMVPRSQRHAFFREAVTPFRDLPEAWLQRYFGGKIMDRAHRVLGFLIYRRMVLALFVLSLGRELRIYLLSFKDGAEL